MIGTREQLIRLAERRMRLAQRAHAERESLGTLIARSDETALVLQRVRGVLQQAGELVRRQPWIAAAAAALIFALRPKRALGWAMRGWGLWRMYRSALRWWQQNIDRSAGTGRPA